jgi:hypothetical protein
MFYGRVGEGVDLGLIGSGQMDLGRIGAKSGWMHGVPD